MDSARSYRKSGANPEFFLEDHHVRESQLDTMATSGSPSPASSAAGGLYPPSPAGRQIRRRPSAIVVQITVIASLGGILFGYDLGVISGALPQLMETFQLSRRQAEICVSILYVGGGLGAALGGPLCDSFGRKRAILITDLVFGLGALVLYAAPNFGTIVLGRVVVGFAVAVSGIADVSYLHEIAPTEFRGAIVSVNEACISLGFLFAFAIGSALSGEGKDTDGWRIMFGVSGLVALIQFLGMLNLPESPKWLEERGRHEESEIATRRINNDNILYRADNDSISAPRDATTTAASAYQSSAEGDIGKGRNMYTPVRNDPCVEGSQYGPSTTTNGGLVQRAMTLFVYQPIFLLKQLRTFASALSREYRRQAYITLFLAVTQQFCGQANVLSYAPLIFASASGGAASSSNGWATLSIGLVKFAVTVLVIWKIEAIGRRFLLLFGMSVIALGQLLLAIAFAGLSSNVNQNEDAAEDQIQGGRFHLALPGVLLVVCGYSCSFGPLTWLLTSELFPTDIRGRALGASTIVTYMCAALVTYTFLSAQAWIGASAVFFAYLLITCVGLIFAWLAIPDTGGKNADEIMKNLDNMPWWRLQGDNTTPLQPLSDLEHRRDDAAARTSSSLEISSHTFC